MAEVSGEHAAPHARAIAAGLEVTGAGVGWGAVVALGRLWEHAVPPAGAIPIHSPASLVHPPAHPVRSPATPVQPPAHPVHFSATPVHSPGQPRRGWKMPMHV
ncbi:hypothetical protein CYMTET_7013 [Cymbomonas tetramitiformis]|uniref:Uncharacterized protein n=1 Tax=Cymbomonas tetramitiformis TaxID=36881 RepID=A0AAE0LHX0_9CHLO|nr:hypothetical protein CYMTET_7013 [Cymbomonas tetramitiformis]